jgi:hypothetical protein
MSLKRGDRELKSTPGGPEFDYLRCNCKTYALSLLRATGIVDASLCNWIIDMPRKSGPLHSLQFEKTEQGWLWSSPFVISRRVSSQQLRHTSPTEIHELNRVIRTNEYIHLFHDLSKMLNISRLNNVQGINDLRQAVLSINTQLEKNSHTTTDLDQLKEQADSAIRTFESAIKNEPDSISRKLLDTLKRLSNFLLGTTHALSLQHELKTIVHAYHHHIKKINLKNVQGTHQVHTKKHSTYHATSEHVASHKIRMPKHKS